MKRRSYKLVTAHDHPRHYSDGRIKEHILIAEKALGYELTSSHPVHHVDGKTRHNANGNLVICQDIAYHHLLHIRTRALRESGNANNRWCSICKTWDRPENIIDIGHNTGAHHDCKRKKDSEYYFSKKEAFRIKNARNYQLRKTRLDRLEGRQRGPITITEARIANERGDKATVQLYMEQYKKGGNGKDRLSGAGVGNQTQ